MIVKMVPIANMISISIIENPLELPEFSRSPCGCVVPVCLHHFNHPALPLLELAPVLARFE